MPWPPLIYTIQRPQTTWHAGPHWIQVHVHLFKAHSWKNTRGKMLW